jgi:hypothetical protein
MSVFLGAVRYEFRMAACRPMLWAAVLPLLALSALLVLTSPRISGLSTVSGQVASVAHALNRQASLDGFRSIEPLRRKGSVAGGHVSLGALTSHALALCRER